MLSIYDCIGFMEMNNIIGFIESIVFMLLTFILGIKYDVIVNYIIDVKLHLFKPP